MEEILNKKIENLLSKNNYIEVDIEIIKKDFLDIGIEP